MEQARPHTGLVVAEAFEAAVDEVAEDAGSYFEAIDSQRIASSERTVSLKEAIEDTICCLEKIIANDVKSVVEELRNKRCQNIYYANMYAYVLFGRAALTLRKEDLDKANAAMAESTDFCYARRKNTSTLSRLVFGEDYNAFTTEQVHAELNYANCLLAESVLTMVQDPSFLSFVQGAFKFRSCYLAFKECVALLKQRSWGADEEKVHFESGVMFGVGVYNLVFATLPQKVLNLLEFVGFHGDEATGEQILLKQSESFEGIMSYISCPAFLIYQSCLYYILGNGNANLSLIEKALGKMSAKFPNAALCFYFQGRLHQVNGRFKDAIERYEAANKVIDDFIPFDAFFRWDQTYVYAFLGRWDEADEALLRLQDKCSWSDATVTYLRAVLMYMKGVNNEGVLAASQLATVIEQMEQVQPLCKRIAGRTVPLEVFCAMRASTFLERNRLTLPHYELMYLWGFFNMFSKNNDTLTKAYDVVTAEVSRLKPIYERDFTFLPDWCLARFMQGVLLRYLKELDQAEKIFKEVIEMEASLNGEIHCAAYSSLELGLLLIDRGQLLDAKERIKATHAYRGFPLSIPVSFKVHSAHKQIKRLIDESEKL